MVNSHLQKIFFHYIINNQGYLSSTEPRFFTEPMLKNIFPHVKEFYEKYKQVPSSRQVEEIVKAKGIEDVTASQIEAVWNIDLKSYDDVWMKENTECFIEYQNLHSSTVDLVNYIKVTQVSAENIKSVVQTAKSIISDRNKIDFEFNEGLDFFNPESHKQRKQETTFKSGYDFIDLVSGGGFYTKSLTVFVGAMKVGKSLWLGNIAGNAILSGHNTAIITLEMDEQKYIKRIGSNLLNIKMDDYVNTAEDSEKIKKGLSNLGFETLVLPGQLIVKSFPTSSATCNDIENYLRRVEERRGIKFRYVIIDYINIMKNWRNPNSENTYMKIKQIAEDVRAMAQINDWAVITATQLKTSFIDSTDMGKSAAAESSALGATVDMMFGIIQDPMMHANRKYKLKVVANRDGGYSYTSKIFDVDYSHMRIKEDPTTSITDGGFVS